MEIVQSILWAVSPSVAAKTLSVQILNPQEVAAQE